ncbi:hypothetical protein [Cyclobacterium roseum]|uniref:hypothetical protein n=1 Tax=Cyclobacterium roseum TaxID=2666137 RepID=UPI001390F77E|nr:hypothetical protein [Cyclobacterium roseum]
MTYIAIPIPTSSKKQDIQIEVTINNQKQAQHYKVELFYWEDCQDPKGHRADCLSEMLSHHDPNWGLYYIGAPTEKFVPITFVEKREGGKIPEV